MPRTVLSVVSTLARCGPVHVLMGLLRHLDRDKFRPVIATLSPEPADSLLDEFLSLGIAVRQLRLSRLGSLVYGARKLSRVIAEEGAEIVHCHGYRADGLAGRAARQAAKVSTLHCELDEDYRLAFGRVAGGAMARWEYAALRRFDGVTAVSTGVAEAARRRGVEAEVILNSVDVERFSPAASPEQVREIRQRLGWPERVPVVLHTGALIKRKRPVEAIGGFLASRLGRRGMMAIAGDGALEAECKRAAGGAANVVFLGKRNDVPELLRAADLLVSASSAEGLPMALLEGCASGVRILASDIGPHRDLQALFPEQVQLFGQEGGEPVRKALDELDAECGLRKARASAAGLEAIADRTMSGRYQELYARMLHPRRQTALTAGVAAFES